MTTRGQVRLSFPAWKIYVFGVDVTQDVSSCVLNWNDGRAPNTAQFILASERDRYITTEMDIRAMYDDITNTDLAASVVESAAAVSALDFGDYFRSHGHWDAPERLLDDAVKMRISRDISDEVKKRVLRSKVSERIRDQRQMTLTDPMEEAIKSLKDTARANAESGRTSIHDVAALTGDVLRFPFQVGQCIFHPGDAVRIFWRDPFNTKDWYFAATGFVSDWVETFSESGDRRVTLTVEDPLRMFRHARFSSNPALFDVSALADPDRDDLFRSWFTESLPDLTLPELLYAITFGQDHAGRIVQEKTSGNEGTLRGIGGFDKNYSVNDSTERRTQDRGVGIFNYDESEVVVLGARPDGASSLVTDGIGTKEFEYEASLASWQKKIDHKIPSTLDDLLVLMPMHLRDEHRPRLKELEVDNTLSAEVVMREIGENPHLYPVDFGRLMILMPASLGPGTNRDILSRDIVSGVATQTEFTTRLAFIFNVCERIDFSFYATPRGDIVCEMPLYSYRPEDFGEAYASRYVFTNSDIISCESHFSDEHVRTQFVLDWWLVDGYTTIGKASQAWQMPGTVTLKSLVPIFGMRSERADPWGFINTEEEARYYAYIKLSQLNADAWTQRFSTLMHLGIGPNRPCYFELRDCIATVRGVTNSIQWGSGGGVNQTMKVNYRRGWSGLMTKDGKRHVYESFGGRMSQPLDYSLLLQDRTNDSATSTKQLSATGSASPSSRSITSAERKKKLATKERYKPYSDEAIALFERAIRKYDPTIPIEWASQSGLHFILDKESGGYVGRPNYLYRGKEYDPDMWSVVRDEIIRGESTSDVIKTGPYAGKQSRAIGLGQLQPERMIKHMPSGLHGIGDAEQEAIAMLRYIRSRYSDPNGAATKYGKDHEGY